MMNVTWYLISHISPSKKTCFIFFNENTLKMMKNSFYFILKALFVLKKFKFGLYVLVMLCIKSGLKFITSQSG